MTVKFSDYRESIFENKLGQVVENSSDRFWRLFVFVKATKFRYSSGYSDCVQNVLAKSYLPCQCYTVYKPKKYCSARKGLGTRLALRCYAWLLSSSFLLKVTTRDRSKLPGNCCHPCLSFIYSLPTQQDCVIQSRSKCPRSFGQSRNEEEYSVIIITTISPPETVRICKVQKNWI